LLVPACKYPAQTEERGPSRCDGKCEYGCGGRGDSRAGLRWWEVEVNGTGLRVVSVVDADGRNAGETGDGFVLQ